MSKASFKQLLKKPSCFIALGFGTGLSPKAPGTMGTLVAIPLYLLVQDWTLLTYIALCIISFGVGVIICQRAADWLKQGDPSAVVWDEIVGFLITMIAAPSGWIWILSGFVLFRFFDIVKPWPVSWADNSIHGGLGIMLDDVIAGVYAALCLQIMVFFSYILSSEYIYFR